jgi:hypothetical protein
MGQLAARLSAGAEVIVGGAIVGEIERDRLKADHAAVDANEGVGTISSRIDGQG